jgi:hypothetical protein
LPLPAALRKLQAPRRVAGVVLLALAAAAVVASPAASAATALVPYLATQASAREKDPVTTTARGPRPARNASDEGAAVLFGAYVPPAPEAGTAEIDSLEGALQRPVEIVLCPG